MSERKINVLTERVGACLFTDIGTFLAGLQPLLFTEAAPSFMNGQLRIQCCICSSPDLKPRHNCRQQDKPAYSFSRKAICQSQSISARWLFKMAEAVTFMGWASWQDTFCTSSLKHTQSESWLEILHFSIYGNMTAGMNILRYCIYILITDRFNRDAPIRSKTAVPSSHVHFIWWASFLLDIALSYSNVLWRRWELSRFGLTSEDKEL